MMKPFFEIKYLELTWYNKETLTKVTESLVALDVIYDEKQGCFWAETTTYPKVNGIKKGILAIQILNKKAAKPYLEMPDGSIKYLTKIVDPDTSIAWWIVKNEWDSIYQQWTSIQPNIVGNLNFVLQGKRCQIVINGSDFTLEQLEQYLHTFKNDLWDLILDDNSPAQVNGKEKQVISINEKTIESISHLVFHASKILETPKVELREIQTLKPRKAVKPVNRTFMEIVTKTNQRFLTSRATALSYNTAENRYVLFALERCYKIIKQLVSLAKVKKDRFQKVTEKFQAQYDSLVGYIKVDRNLVISDLERIRECTRIEYWRKELEHKLLNHKFTFPGQSGQCLYLKLEGYTKNQWNNTRDGFFVFEWNGEEWAKRNNKATILRLNDKFLDLVNILEPGMILEFTGEYKLDEKERSFNFIFKTIYSIELWDYPEKLKKAKQTLYNEIAISKKLSQNNWVKYLSKKELEEQEKEKISLQNRINFYTENHKSCTYAFEKIEPKCRQLNELIKKFKTLSIKPSSYFPNSMTFIQNPHYQSVHNNYKALRESINLQDEDLLLSLEEIDKVGIINIPLLYERWVLMQIILTLKSIFRFVPKDDWKNKLINAISTNQKNIKIELFNEKAKRYISLIYEGELPNGKRPDFTLDLTWFKKEDIEYKSKEFKRFILDAKFYDKSTFEKSGGMIAKIDELYKGKNYSEDDKNPVFLIHPCKNIIDKPVTSQQWGKYSFLGEIDFLNDGNLPAHNKGAVFLNPIDNTLYNDELQRLLGMFLQYKLEDSDVLQKEKDITDAVPICVQCGSSDMKEHLKSSQYRDKTGIWRERTSRSVWLQCAECEQWQIYNHCFNDYKRLIKNGTYWSYHSARALEPFNMKCPHCGEWGAW